MKLKSTVCFSFIVIVVLQFVVAITFAQELEPRRWTHLPMGLTVTGAGYVRTEGEIFLSPVLNIEDAEFTIDSYAFKYVHAFGLLGKSAQISVADIYSVGRWAGTRDNAPVSAERDGFSDPVIRIAVNLLGAPALKGAEFQEYRKAHQTGTIVGAALSLHLPLGEYMNDKLINLGNNRYTIRPQLGVVHRRGSLMLEMTGAVWFFEDNDDFLNGSELQQDPLYTVQGHSIYTLQSKLWLSASLGYGYGAESTIDGVDKDDKSGNLVWAASFGKPITKRLGMKMTWLSKRTQEDVGCDSDSIAVAGSYIW